MQRYIAKRLIQGFFTLWVLAIVVFALARASGNPVNLLAPPDASPEEVANITRVLGLDKPYHIQFFSFISHAITGDFGTSIRARKPAAELFFDRLPNSLGLVVVAMGIGLVIALPLGVLAAVKRGTPLDRLTQALAVMGMAAPAFWVGLVLMQIMSVKLRWLPVSGMGGPQHYILPAFTLGIFLVAGYVRLLRSSMLDVLDSEFVKLARIKGLSERVVVWKHAFRNALIPVLSFGGVYFAILVGGAIVVETVFAWPGVGRLTYEAVMNRDYPVLQAAVLLQASFIMVLNILVDILYAYVDPRIRYG